jgi:hypothetical protein
VRIVETPSFLPLPSPQATRPRRSADFSAGAQGSSDDATVLPRPGLVRSLQFLAQYLVREILPKGEVPASRWNTRETVYRQAADRQTMLSSDSEARQFVIDA